MSGFARPKHDYSPRLAQLPRVSLRVQDPVSRRALPGRPAVCTRGGRNTPPDVFTTEGRGETIRVCNPFSPLPPR
jgi:hypothetical protein